MSRRKFLGLAAMSVPVVAGVAACSSSKSPSSSGTSAPAAATSAPAAATSAPAAATSAPAAATSAAAASPVGTGTTYWFLTGQPQQAIRENAVKAYNAANPQGTIKYSEFANDQFKTKIAAAIGAGQAPTIIWGWGGGGLRSYVQGNQVIDLTDFFNQNADVKSRLFPSAFGAGTVDGKIYAMPCETVQPIVLFYNKDILSKCGVAAPTSWDDIMSMVPKINAKGYAPFSLAGGSLWTNMMWLEFLFDRVGGPDIFQAAFTGSDKQAWSNPAAIDALTKVQDLVKANGFQKGFQTTTADSNADCALMYTEKAAMMLHGSWTYGTMKNYNNGAFTSSGKLGFMNFPAVTGGKGDPSDTVGNPAQYISISSKASAAQQAIALNFFKTGVLQDAEVKAWIQQDGAVPIVMSASSLLAAAPDHEFMQFIYDVSSKAAVFAQSWDQALSPAAAQVLLDSIGKLFALSMTPQQFGTTMNGQIGK